MVFTQITVERVAECAIKMYLHVHQLKSYFLIGSVSTKPFDGNDNFFTLPLQRHWKLCVPNRSLTHSLQACLFRTLHTAAAVVERSAIAIIIIMTLDWKCTPNKIKFWNHTHCIAGCICRVCSFPHRLKPKRRLFWKKNPIYLAMCSTCFMKRNPECCGRMGHDVYKTDCCLLYNAWQRLSNKPPSNTQIE